jgi:hypothetical protein
MKNKCFFLLSFAFVSFYSNSQNAQWVSQSTSFASARNIASVSTVNSTIAWAAAMDPAGIKPVQDFTRTIDGLKWTIGTVATNGGPNKAAGLDVANIFALDANTAWVSMFDNSATLGGGIFKTADGGTTWVKQISASFAAPNGTPNFVYFFDVNNGVCMGDSNTGYWEIYTTGNGGTNWTRVSSLNIPANLMGETGNTNTYSASGSSIWFGTSSGRIYRSTDKGLTWSVSNTPYSLTSIVSAISFKDLNNGLAIADNGTSNSGIISTTNGGASWVMENSGITGGIDIKTGIAFLPGTTGTYFITGDGGIGSDGSAYSLDNGLTWTNIDVVPHIGISFAKSSPVGWSGSTNTSPTVGGIFKWTGIVITGIHSSSVSESLSIYPNPGNGNFNVQNSLIGKSVNIKVSNEIGKEIYSETFNSWNGILDLSSQPTGIYFLMIKSDDKIFNNKLIIQ